MRNSDSRRGLTLFELVVVLAILAAVTAAVSVATDRILSQRRFEQSQRTLDAVRIAILGGHENDTLVASPDIAGFVADVGRLPLAVDIDPSPEVTNLQPVELWQKPQALAAFSMHALSGEDAGVSLAGGWRGPYVRLPTGGDRLTDGWGRSPVLLALDGTNLVPAAAGQEVVEVASLGSDGSLGAGGDAWSRDLAAAMHDGASPPALLTAASLSVRVVERSAEGDLIAPQGEGTLTVKLFFQHPVSGVANYSPAPLVGPLATIPVIDLTVRNEGNIVIFPAIGPKVLRAYWRDASGNLQRVSQPLQISLTHAGQQQWDLVLPSGAP